MRLKRVIHLNLKIFMHRPLSVIGEACKKIRQDNLEKFMCQVYKFVYQV